MARWWFLRVLLNSSSFSAILRSISCHCPSCHCLPSVLFQFVVLDPDLQGQLRRVRVKWLVVRDSVGSKLCARRCATFKDVS